MTQRRCSPVLLYVALATLPATIVPAQDHGPPAQLKKLAPLAGTWKTSGTMMMAPDQPETPWTSDSSYRWVLGGHFLRADSRVDFAGGMGSLQFVSFMGWDRERKRYLTWDVSSMGSLATSEMFFLEDGSIVQTIAGVEEGQPTLDRWITRVDGDKMSFVGHRAVGTGEFFAHVTGSGTRSSAQASELEFEDTAFMGEAAVEKMERFQKTAGTYEVKGWYVPMPGAPKAEITGTDQREMMFGNTVLAGHIHGNAIAGMPPYEGFAFVSWDAVDRSYKVLGLSSYGEAHVQEGRWNGNQLVLTGAHLQMGQPMVSRGLLDVDDNGALTGMSAHAILGTAAPAHVFEASYRKKDS